MEIFAHHTIEHSVTSNMYYYALAGLALAIVLWVVKRSTK